MRSLWRRYAGLAGPILVVVLVVVLAAALGGQVGAWIVVAASVAAAVAPMVGVVVHRPPQLLPWVLYTLPMSFWAVNGVRLGLDPTPDRTSELLVAAGQLCATVNIVSLFVRNRRSLARSRHGFLAQRSDALLLGGITLLVLAQVVASQRGASEPWVAAAPATDALIGGLLLRFLSTRQDLRRSSRIVLVAALLTTGFDLRVSSAGLRVAPFGDPVWALWAAAACLFAWAPLHSSMRYMFTEQTLTRRRNESSRLVGILPLAIVPVAIYLADPPHRLPALAFLLASAGTAAVGLLRAVSAVRSTEDLARHDPLTGLANRLGLADAYLRPPPGGPGWGSLCVVGLDDFKQVNDAFGHDVGDGVLCQLADRLQGAVVDGGLVARSGSDEFALLVTGGPDQVRQVVEAALAEPFRTAGHHRTLAASAGLREVDPGEELGQVISDAHVALSAAKVEGRGGITRFRPSLREAALSRLSLAEDLRQALTGDPASAGLRVHYQPLVELGGNGVVGCEALVRWQHPVRGPMRPDSFLPLAEQHDLAHLLDLWVLRESLLQVQDWSRTGTGEVYVSVNLGRSSMESPGLADAVLGCLDESRVEPSRLHLEITEHEELSPDAGSVALQRVAATGVRISLDDFGIGYTALDYTRRYPITQLKLDRSITLSLQTQVHSPLVEGIVSLASALELEVLAEGIETEPQRRRLADLGVGFGQGFHLGRPVPAAELGALLAVRRATASET